MDCFECNKLLSRYLMDVPEKWRVPMVDVICNNLISRELDCPDITKCETLTTLTAFTFKGNVVEISYINETGLPLTRSFDFSSLLDSSLKGVDPKCLMSQEDWDALTYTEQIQAIVTFRCDCCVN